MYKQIVLGSMTLMTVLSHGAEPITVHLKPPCLDDSALVIKEAWDRPRRVDGVRIALEETDEHTILQCYGHGGFGITTLFGSIQKALELIVEKNPARDTKVCIIGSGCMGLTLAIELAHIGFIDITVITKERYENISWKSGGFFDPGVGIERKPQDILKVNLGVKTFEVLHEIELGLHPYLKEDVVHRMPIYYPAHINVGVEILETRHLMPPHELVTIDFGNGVVYKDYKKQFTYFIDVNKLMTQLWIQIGALNISVIDQEITDLAQCKAPIICNCTGLGSKDLTNDQHLEPARGHFFMLKAQPDAPPLEYLLFAPFVRQERREYVAFFPKTSYRTDAGEIACTGMIGGTFIPYHTMSDTELAQLDEKEFEKLIARARAYFYGK